MHCCVVVVGSPAGGVCGAVVCGVVVREEVVKVTSCLGFSGAATLFRNYNMNYGKK